MGRRNTIHKLPDYITKVTALTTITMTKIKSGSAMFIIRLTESSPTWLHGTMKTKM